MKKFILFVVMPLAIACNSGNTKTSEATTSDSTADNSKKESVTYPYPVSYSSQFEIGDPEKAKTILELWKDFDNNTLDNSAGKFADTVTMLFSGMEMYTSRDSMLAATKAYRNTYNTVSSTVDAIVSTKSVDKGDDWVLVWGTETHTDKNNVTDSVHLQETWRLNKDGKVDFMMQYMRKHAGSK